MDYIEVLHQLVANAVQIECLGGIREVYCTVHVALAVQEKDLQGKCCTDTEKSVRGVTRLLLRVNTRASAYYCFASIAVSSHMERYCNPSDIKVVPANHATSPSCCIPL